MISRQMFLYFCCVMRAAKKFTRQGGVREATIAGGNAILLVAWRLKKRYRGDNCEPPRRVGLHFIPLTVFRLTYLHTTPVNECNRDLSPTMN
jgi:hypothetical protein